MTLLCHYTDGNALASILSTGELWLQDPRMLNDAEELRHGFKVLEASVRASAAGKREAYLRRDVVPSTFEAFVDRQCKNILNAMQSMMPISSHRRAEMPDFTLIFCLSEDPDSLSQWRAYGGEYAIGFDSDLLQAATRAKITAVEYLRIEPLPALSAAADAFFQRTLDCFVRNGAISDQEVLHSGIADVLDDLLVNGFFAKVKHPSFCQEAEHRLIMRFDRDDDRVQFRQVQGYPTPFAKVKIFDPKALISPRFSHGPVSPSKAMATCPIRALVSGPQADPLRTTAFLQSAKLKGFYIDHTDSKVPYRRR